MAYGIATCLPSTPLVSLLARLPSMVGQISNELMPWPQSDLVMPFPNTTQCLRV